MSKKNIKSCPCKDCNDRNIKYVDDVLVSCHTSCLKYKEWVKKEEEINKQIKEKEAIDRSSWCSKSFSEVNYGKRK